MNEQEFGTELFEASAKCLEIASVAQCITEVDVNSRTAALWLNSAICNIASQLEHLAEKLEELETEFHSQGKFKYPCEINTHTHTRLNYWEYVLKQVADLLQIAITKNCSATETDTVLRISFDKVVKVLTEVGDKNNEQKRA